jgi:hypothetical protein
VPRDHAGRALEVEDGFLQLRIEHGAVAHDQHAVEQLAVLRVMQVGEKVRCPGNRVGLARAGRMLNQIALARPFVEHVGHQGARRGELVIARKDDRLRLLLVIALADEVAVHDVEPALACPHFLPQVGRGKTFGVGRVAGLMGTWPSGVA